MQRLKNSITLMGPHVSEELAPAEFVDQLVTRGDWLLAQNFSEYLCKCQHTMGEIRRKPGDCTRQMIASSRVIISLDGRYGLDRRQSSGGWNTR